MTRHYNKEYFEDQVKISQYEQRFMADMGGEYYHIIILALLNVLVRMIKHWVIDGKIATRWHGEDHE